MDINKIDLRGFDKNFKKLITTYKIRSTYEDRLAILGDIKLSIYQDTFGTYYSEPDTGIKDKNGFSIYSDGFGNTEEEAISDTLRDIYLQAQKLYPQELPVYAIASRIVDKIEEEKEFSTNFPIVIPNPWHWKYDKLRKGVTSGPFIEFQLEDNGKYHHWSKDSFFIGDTIISSLYKLFERTDNIFDSNAINLFSPKELKKLHTKVIQKIKLLSSINTLADYLEQISPLFEWVQEENKTIWKELRDALIEFLEELLIMIRQGIKENKALYILGY